MMQTIIISIVAPFFVGVLDKNIPQIFNIHGGYRFVFIFVLSLTIVLLDYFALSSRSKTRKESIALIVIGVVEIFFPALMLTPLIPMVTFFNIISSTVLPLYFAHAGFVVLLGVLGERVASHKTKK